MLAATSIRKELHMPSLDNPEPATDTSGTDGPAVVSLTWFLTQTFDHDVPVAALAEASGYTSDEIAAHPAALVGVAGERLAALLTGYPLPDSAVGGREVEIARADFDATPTLAELADAAYATLHATADTGQHTPAGQALAAMLAGLHREGTTHA
jgi:hypothetical protein